MTTLVAQVFEDASSIIRKDANDNISFHHCRNELRSKERKHRHKCNTALKRKLKKYKLRQDGKEDQDILDVSGILESSLYIRSPNEGKSSAELELEQLRPINYLFKMGRRNQAKHITEKSVKSKTVESETSEDVKQTSPTIESTKQNAFKLLMDSRNKSMGQNSPGKDKPIEEFEKLELLEFKRNKAKKHLLLQKMAESKGSLKRNELEENLTKCINKKMEKRAKRLQSLISNIEPKNEKKDPNTQNGRNPLISIKPEKYEKISDKPVKTLQLVNMFTEIECTNQVKREISKEDAEFLKKLSPSLKKKESMLSYFKKLETEPDCSTMDTENDNSVIKVKLGPKNKKKGRKKKLSLNRDKLLMEPIQELQPVIDEIQPHYIQILPTDSTEMEEISKKERKRKRQGKVTFCDDAAVSSSNILLSNDDGRSKRNANKPVRYNEDAAISSSDEELHIFTPKKKKVTNEKKITIVDLTPEISERTEPTKTAEKHVKANKSTLKPKISDKGKSVQKSVKLAPIFATKSQLDPIANEAKQKFLQSGVPEKLKKMMLKQVDKNIVGNHFVRVVHIQQLEVANNLVPIQLNIVEDSSIVDQNDPITSKDLTFKMLLSMHPSQETSVSPNHTNPQTVLQNLKDKYPRYPVYRTYRLLRGKKKGDYKVSTNYLDLDNSVEVLNASIDNQNQNPEQLSWSDKYKPLAASEIIGNFESVKELRKWLVSWTESDMKRKATNGDSDSSDFCQSDGDSRDSVKSSNNLLVLSGPVGSGKTSSVYAIAAELSIKVIEVNASSRRTGKIMLQDLQEATQSHKVNRQTSSNENSQNSQKLETVQPSSTISNPVKKRGRPKKDVDSSTEKPVLNKKSTKEKSENPNGLSASQDSTRTCMSLILIDDADIVFDQDDGFCSAIVQLVHSSKRPVILITSSLSCPHLQRFIQSSKVLKLNPLLPNILGTWLDIMCLADSGICWPGIGSKVLNFYKGDLRKTIICLQFYVCSQEQVISQEIESCSQNTECRLNIEDEASNMSWTDRDVDDKNLNLEATEFDFVKTFMLQQAHSKHNRCPNALFNIWWNVPKLLSVSETTCDELTDKDEAPKNKSKSIESISQVLDSLSLCDLFSQRSYNVKGNLSSDPWFSDESHSVSELENFDKYDRHYCTSDEIAHELACGSISIAQDTFGCKRKIYLDIPGMSQQRQKDRIVSRHNKLTSFLSPQAILDRKALALDYWSTCRSICRIEKCKTDSNYKRNNRFCHYLKSVSVLCKNESFDKLTYSLCSSALNLVPTEVKN